MEQNNQQPFNPNPSLQNANDAMIPHHKKVGPIVAILVLVLVIVIAGLYFFASNLNAVPPSTTDTTVASNPAINNQTEVQQTSSAANAAPTVAPITNTSDDPQSLSNDLNASTRGLDNQSFQ